MLSTCPQIKGKKNTHIRQEKLQNTNRVKRSLLSTSILKSLGKTAAIFRNGHPHPHLLIVIKFGLIFSFSHLSSPSVRCDSSLSHSLPHHPSLSLGSSEPLTSDPQAGSPAGQEPGGGRQAERRGGRSVIGGCQLLPLAMDTALAAAAIATGRGGSESSLQRAAGMELSVMRFWL